jgi:hypothetical protein
VNLGQPVPVPGFRHDLPEPRSHGPDQAAVVADQQGCGALGGQLVFQRRLPLDVQMVGRLVQQDQIRRGRPDAGQHRQPLPAARKPGQRQVAQAFGDHRDIKGDFGAPVLALWHRAQQNRAHGDGRKPWRNVLRQMSGHQPASAGDPAFGQLDLSGNGREAAIRADQRSGLAPISPARSHSGQRQVRWSCGGLRAGQLRISFLGSSRSAPGFRPRQDSRHSAPTAITSCNGAETGVGALPSVEITPFRWYS